jgi:hypothetical protein
MSGLLEITLSHYYVLIKASGFKDLVFNLTKGGQKW